MFDYVCKHDVSAEGKGSEIYQVTGPVERFAGQIASQGFVVGWYRFGASDSCG
jgi:hypothetical protein